MKNTSERLYEEGGVRPSSGKEVSRSAVTTLTIEEEWNVEFVPVEGSHVGISRPGKARVTPGKRKRKIT